MASIDCRGFLLCDFAFLRSKEMVDERFFDWLGWVQSGFGTGEGVDYGSIFGPGAAARWIGGLDVGSILCSREAHT